MVRGLLSSEFVGYALPLFHPFRKVRLLRFPLQVPGAETADSGGSQPSRRPSGQQDSQVELVPEVAVPCCRY